MSGLARRLEPGQDVGVVGQQVVFVQDAEAEALAEGVGELVVDERLGRARPTSRGSSTANFATASRATARSVKTIVRSIDVEVGQDHRHLLRSQHAAGQAVAEEVVEPVGAEPGQGPLEQGIDRVVEELARAKSPAAAAPRRYRRGGGTSALSCSWWSCSSDANDEIDRVRERRVRDVVEQPGHLLAEAGAEACGAAGRRPGCARTG